MASHVIRLHELLAKTTSFTSTTTPDVGQIRDLVVFCRVTAASGTTPTLDIDVQDSPDLVNFFTARSFPQITAAGSFRLEIGNIIGRAIRIDVTIGGTTPSFTFEVIAVANPQRGA